MSPTTLPQLIINADDLGLSPGVNSAVYQAYTRGGLTHASLFANADYTPDAVENVIKKCPDLSIGLHIYLDQGFVFLLLRSILPGKKQFLNNLEQEIENQILTLKNYKISIKHLDSHRHVHMIPAIFKLVSALARKHHIPRIRLIKENFFDTLHITKNISASGLIKFIILEICRFFISTRPVNNFFSILHSCQIKPEYLKNIPENTEIMLHPGDPVLDKKILSPDYPEYQHLVSKWRETELQAVLALSR